MSKNVKVLVYSAVCIALASITSLIKVFEFPTGGSITLASTRVFDTQDPQKADKALFF